MQQQLKKANRSDGRITLVAISESEEREQITVLAYALWQARGCPEGTPDEDWFRAQREIAGSKRMDEEGDTQDCSEQSIDAEVAHPSSLRFPVGSEVFKTAHAGASRRR